MRPARFRTMLVGTGVALALGAGWNDANAAVSGPVTHARAAMAAAALTSTWGAAEEVPGTATLDQGGSASVNAVSCASPGNCAVAGYYSNPSGFTQAFVAGETMGTWSAAEQVPGTAALNQGGDAQVSTVSCASAGNCTAAGYYTDATAQIQAFVVNETAGTWGTAQDVPGADALNQGGAAGVSSLSCTSPGNCSGGGFYLDGSFHFQSFVVDEANGSWGTAEQIPGLAALNQGGGGGVDSVSCTSPGNCSAGGGYLNAASSNEVFVVNETNGTWGTAEQVPGTAALNTGGDAGLNSVSCGSAGNCSGGGQYIDGSGHNQPFVVNEVNGTWGTAVRVPGIATLNKGGQESRLNSVSCASAGNCSAAGNYSDSAGRLQAFVVKEVKGTWSTAKEVPGTGTLNKGGFGSANSVSCGAVGNCSAVGTYKNSSGLFEAFVANEVSGTWGTAQEVPGIATLNKGDANATSASCSAVGQCAAVGYYTDGSSMTQAFVASEN